MQIITVLKYDIHKLRNNEVKYLFNLELIGSGFQHLKFQKITTRKNMGIPFSRLLFYNGNLKENPFHQQSE